MSIQKKQHIGNKYYLGMHFVPFEKVDAIVQLIAAKKSAWRGWWTGGRLNIDKPKHMGGDEKEGGISGGFDLLTGEVTQGTNDYLQRLYGLSNTLASAFRGCVSIVARQPYIGANTGRLPELGWKGINVDEVVGGWLPEYSQGYEEYYAADASIYIAFEVGFSTDDFIGRQTETIAAFIRTLSGKSPTIKVVAWADAILGSIERRDASPAQVEEMAVWVESWVTVGDGSNFGAALGQAAAFFGDGSGSVSIIPPSFLGGLNTDIFGRGETKKKNRQSIIIFTSQGIPDPGTLDGAIDTLASIPGVQCYCFLITFEGSNDAALILMDNTPVDGIPTNPGPGELVVAASTATLQWVDLNAIHHIRHLLITKKRGGQATPDEIGESFEAAAEQCFFEGMFLSVPYSKYSSNREAINDIKRHIDAQVFRSSVTGKWEVKLIRGDYTFEELPVLDSAIVSDWSGVDIQAASELPNQVTVTYVKRGVQEPGSVTKANVAAVRRKGRVIPSDPIDYPLVTWRPLAARLAARDASGISVPALSGSLPLLYLPAGLGLGDAVVINEPEVKINNVICRIVEIVEPDGIDNSAMIRIVEDRFTLGQEILGPDDIETPIEALPASPHQAEETPYYVLVVQEGQADVDAALTETEELGFLMVAAGAPSPAHYSATVATGTGGEYEEVFELSFSGVATLQTALTRAGDDVTVMIDLNDTLGDVAQNDLATIGTEIVRIDDMVVSGESVILTIGRAALDTAPVKHLVGETILFWAKGEPLDYRYLDGETLDVIMLTNTADDSLEPGAAPVDSVTFASRAIRPYPPGQFKINGSYADQEFYADAVLTWVHRDRTQQTTAVPEDHDDSGIGPEAGTSYTVKAEAFAAGVSLGVIYTATGITGTTHDYPDATPYPDGTEFIRLSVTSVRDGYESWQSPAIDVRVAPALGVNGSALGVNGNILGLKG